MTIRQQLATGQWDDNQSWQLIEDDKLPNTELCTAVYCLAILPETKQVVLTRNHRGWEMLGGHIESGETIEQALQRECLEEGGFTPEHYRLFGYRKVTAKQPVAHTQKEGSFYPYPHGYIPHFTATSTLPLQKPSGEEITESRAFSFDKLESLGMEQFPIVRLMLEAWLNSQDR
ncbi:MAG TPA: NUDIX domain-containing protein [Candidatus Saccharimonadales bacterium]|nr:NUDIX domain-containing protein [Candidatus Saccharimonadales bacterium]